jgi:serine/threonine protein kinase
MRLQVTEESDRLLSGSLADADSRITKVVCEPVKEDLMKYGEKGPRHVLIYAKLSANTLVHPFYGIAQRSNQRWIVMKDLRQCPSLRDMMRDGKVPKSVLERTSIACDIARTMEYLHSVEILVKRLSDTTILLSRENNVVIPYLTNIDRARLVSLSSLEFDLMIAANSDRSSSSWKILAEGLTMFDSRLPNSRNYLINNTASTPTFGGMGQPNLKRQTWLTEKLQLGSFGLAVRLRDVSFRLLRRGF